MVNDKMKEFGNADSTKKTVMKVYKPPRRKLPVDVKLRSLYESVRDFKDAKDKKLSEVIICCWLG